MRARLKHFIIYCVFVLLGVRAALGCDLCGTYCSCEKPKSTGVFAGVFEQFTHFGTAQNYGKEVPNTANQYMDSSVTQLILGAHLTDWLSAQLNVPIIYRAFRRPEGNGNQTGSVSGIGDVSLLGNLRLFRYDKNDTVAQVNFMSGVKFPTGDPDRLQEEFNETESNPPSGIHGHDLALGSGSFDALVGGATYLRWKRLYATGAIQYAIRTTGDFNYRYANDLTWNGGPGVLLWSNPDGQFGLQCVVSGEWKGLDTFQGQDAKDTGMTAVYLGPAAQFAWKENLRCECGVDIPVVQHNSAFQIVPDYRIRAAATWHF